MLKKIARKIIYKHLIRKGFHSYMVQYHGDQLCKDWFDTPNYSIKEKLWAHKRGFFVNQIKVYGLNDKNYKSYLSDYDYHKMFPLNNHYSKWVNDKLTLKYVLSKYDNYLPEYYLRLDQGRIIKLMNFPDDIEDTMDGVIELVRRKKKIVAKQIEGSCSIGFYLLEYVDGCFWANKHKYSEEKFLTFLESLKGYILTEFITQNVEYEKIYSKAVHTLRVQTVRQNNQPAECIFTFIRWGNKEGNDSAVKEMEECVTAIPDRITGEIKEGFYVNENNEYVTCTEHPLTGESITGIVPNWEVILKKCLEMHDYLAELEYLGFDVIVTEDAFKICEINTSSSIRAIQHVMPLLEDEKTRKYYESHIH